MSGSAKLAFTTVPSSGKQLHTATIISLTTHTLDKNSAIS